MSAFSRVLLTEAYLNNAVYARAQTNEFFRARSFFLITFLDENKTVTRGIRHCASHYIDPLPFQLIGGFPRGAFDDQTFRRRSHRHPLSLYISPFPGSGAEVHVQM